VPTAFSVLAFGCSLLLFYLVYLNYINLPSALLISDEVDNPGRFIAERAKADLAVLASQGPRVGGSFANEVHAANFLLNTANEIKRTAHPAHLIEVDHAVHEGGFLHPEPNVYRGVQNIVVKISAPNSQSTSSLMLNAHFDSVPTSPGGGDDGTMTVIMMEILRVISKQSTPLKHAIIFVFNGCEENELQGSHAFISYHKWAGEVKAFINMDVAGNGGREILFQTGPQHPWLMRVSGRTASLSV
jgi:Peptidase family M28